MYAFYVCKRTNVYKRTNANANNRKCVCDDGICNLIRIQGCNFHTHTMYHVYLCLAIISIYPIINTEKKTQKSISQLAKILKTLLKTKNQHLRDIKEQQINKKKLHISLFYLPLPVDLPLPSIKSINNHNNIKISKRPANCTFQNVWMQNSSSI